jgi:hypothetical protein
MQLRDYQESISTDAAKMLEWLKICYLSMQPRTGKTITALVTAEKFGAKSVLFLTKKKAISSIKADYDKRGPSFNLICINYEQIYNLSPDYVFDIVICDEAHCLGQMPKPAERTKELKKICEGKPIIFLSGTPNPESWCQLYHQFWISSFSPFKEWSNFYAWAKEFVFVQKMKIHGNEFSDYTNNPDITISQLERKINSRKTSLEEKGRLLAEVENVRLTTAQLNEKIQSLTKHLFISYTQEEAGFMQLVKEVVLKVRMGESTYRLAEVLRKKKVYIGKDGQEILADTAVKLQQKFHQIFSGTIIDEKKNGICFDHTKARFIKERFAGQKFAVFYKFRAEYMMLVTTFGYDRLTEDPMEFNESDRKIFVSQIISGREGVNLSTADCLVFLNIDFAAVSYWQARERLQDKNRTKEAVIYWVFSEGGIEERIYETVLNKKDYTNAHFKKDYQIKYEKQGAR